MSVDQPFRVLVVDDNAIDQRVEASMLKRAGVHADVASSGEQAVEAHRLHPYDLILMDVQMPVMDGLEATRLIRDMDGRQPVIVAVTANGFTGKRERCLLEGMDGHVSKPYTSQQLIRAMRRALAVGSASTAQWLSDAQVSA
jgi:two-component system, sensor histidine kinase and response regulator